ncbi:MAG: SPASM domain-containing protein [Desulfobacterales bacterium]|jgi:hypothetical protein
MKIAGSMEITTVIGCRNDCQYCPQDQLVRAYKARSDVYRMHPDAFETCLSKIPLDIAIHFSGMAEPWLNPDCTRMLLHAVDRGHTVEVYTTLVGMRPEDVPQLEPVSFSKFVVHLPNERYPSRIRIDSRYLDMVRRVAESRIQNLVFVAIGAVNRQLEEAVGQPVRIDPVQNRAGNLSTTSDAPDATRARGKIRCISCGGRLNHNVLLPNGDVVLCCMDYGLVHVIGNLLREDYDDLFGSPEYLRVRRGLTDESVDILCRYCHNIKPVGVWARVARNFRRLRGV